MKKLVQCVFLISISCLSAEARIEANFKVPPRVYALGELEEAIAEAQKKGEPISYLYGNPQSTCPLHNRDAEVALKEAKRFSVVVFLPTGRDDIYDKVSPLIISALRSDKAGKIIPKLATATPDGTKVTALMANEDMDERGAFRKYRNQVEAGETFDFGDSNTNFIVSWYLRNQQGHHYKASFVSLDGDTLSLKRLDNGSVFKMNINKFTDAVGQYARALSEQIKASEEAAKPKTEVQHPVEIWISADGRELKGRFINLDGDDITLLLQTGSEVTFKTNLLSPSSLERARELSGKI